MDGEDFALQRLDSGAELYCYPAGRFKSTRVDFFLSTPLCRGQHTRLALIGRLLERGTRRLPDLQSLNRFLDELYGAGFAVEVEALGDHQILHLSLEVVASPYLPGGEDLLTRGVRFLGEVLAEPLEEKGGFRQAYLGQEKRALAHYIRSLANDKSAYAHRRCLEAMCRDAPCGLPAYGDPADFRAINARNLLSCHRRLLACSPIALYFSGHVVPETVAQLGRELLCWGREPGRRAGQWVLPASTGAVQELFESQEVSQGRLVLGYRTGIGLADEDYPGLVLFNALLGGEAQSRLFRQLREEAGLCYHIGTHLEPLCGLLFVEAGIEPAAYTRVRAQVEAQFELLRQGRLVPGELELTRQCLLRNLWALDDSCEGLVRFFYQQLLAGCQLSRSSWQQRLEAVGAEDLARIAVRVQLDTSFFLHPSGGEWRP
ncbi:MAG: insulinase family protein [Candidatus Latescibacteria bacterium]|nr:insulinase family protein [Candidatus Latescibacterota bacterium]